MTCQTIVDCVKLYYVKEKTNKMAYTRQHFMKKISICCKNETFTEKM